MLKGRTKEQWAHTTSLVVTLININRDPKSNPVTFDQLYPFKAAKKKVATDPLFEKEMSSIEWTKLQRQGGIRGGRR